MSLYYSILNRSLCSDYQFVPAPGAGIRGSRELSVLTAQSVGCRTYPRIFQEVGYLLDSGSPYRLWFRFGFGAGVNNPIQGNGLDCYGLLHETEEELAAAF